MRMQMKRFIATVAALTLVCGIAPTKPFADGFNNLVITANAANPASDFYYTVSNNQVYISKYRGTDSVVVVPSSIDGLPVTDISDWAFCDNEHITSVTLPNTITEIRGYSFENCTALQEIIIPDSITAIGDSAFHNCTALKSLKIPSSVTFLDDWMIWNCPSLQEIQVSKDNPNYCSVDGVLYNKEQTKLLEFPEDCQITDYVVPSSIIASKLYITNNHLVSFTVPEDSPVELLSLTAHSLQKLSLPKTVNKLSLYNCHMLSDIEVDASNPTFCDIDGILFSKDKTKLLYYPGGRTESEYVLPDFVTTLQTDAFRCCDNLTNIRVSADNPNFCDIDGVLCSKDGTKLIRYPSGRKTSSYILPSSVELIEPYAFADCSLFKSMTFGANVCVISDYAFLNCTSLSSIVIVDEILGIQEYAFNGCDNFKNVYYGGTAEDWSKYCADSYYWSHDTYVDVHGEPCLGWIYQNALPYLDILECDATFIEGVSLVLDGTLQLKIKFNKDILSTSKDDYSINGAPCFTEDNIFVYDLPAKDYMKPIEFSYMGELVQSFTLSDVLTKYSQNQLVSKLASSMNEYCSAANAYFSKQKVADYSDSWNTVKDAIGYRETLMDPSYYASSLLLKSSTILRHYYTEPVEGSTAKDGYYYIDEVVPADKFSRKNKPNYLISLPTVNVNDYIYRALSSDKTDANLKNLCVALYNYGKEAKEYSKNITVKGGTGYALSDT